MLMYGAFEQEAEKKNDSLFEKGRMLLTCWCGVLWLIMAFTSNMSRSSSVCRNREGASAGVKSALASFSLGRPNPETARSI